MTSSLPPEIWFAIVGYLPRRDQLCVAQLSAQLCAVARRAVYRNVELRSNGSAVEATLALLIRDYSVARNVRRLHIYTATSAIQQPAWFDTDVLAGMTNLRQLELTGLPFHTKEGQLEFNNAVSELLPALRQLEYHDPYSRYGIPQRPETHVPVLQITGLQEITWIERDTFNSPLHILPPINASRETLTHIRIPVASSYAATCEPLVQFFTFHFPHLSTLHLGGWIPMPPVDAALTHFLIAHPLIEDLHLGFPEPYGRRVQCHVSPHVAVGPGTLPNLRHLTVDTFNLGIFVRNRISSLQTLESLRIGVDYLEEEEKDIGFVGIYRALEACGGLPELKALELELEGLDNEAEKVDWIAGLGKLCPQVKRFRGDYDVWVEAVSNQSIFASYTNLKSLALPGGRLCRLPEWDRMKYVKEFAAGNPSVTDLRFYVRPGVGKFHYRMVRNTEGKITAMVEVLKNGMERILF